MISLLMEVSYGNYFQAQQESEHDESLMLSFVLERTFEVSLTGKGARPLPPRWSWGALTDMTPSKPEGGRDQRPGWSASPAELAWSHQQRDLALTGANRFIASAPLA